MVPDIDVGVLERVGKIHENKDFEFQINESFASSKFSKELQQSLYYFTNENPFIGGLLQEMNLKYITVDSSKESIEKVMEYVKQKI